jgi:hypothetical protein
MYDVCPKLPPKPDVPLEYPTPDETMANMSFILNDKGVDFNRIVSKDLVEKLTNPNEKQETDFVPKTNSIRFIAKNIVKLNEDHFDENILKKMPNLLKNIISESFSQTKNIPLNVPKEDDEEFIETRRAKKSVPLEYKKSLEEVKPLINDL